MTDIAVSESKPPCFQDLFAYSTVVDFCRRVLTPSYVERVPGHQDAMTVLMDEAFALLATNRQDEDRFREAMARLATQLFRKQDPEFWFNRFLLGYKHAVKPSQRAERLRPFLQGSRILDLGCGDGLTSLALQQLGYEPFLTDILDYRDERACVLPFHPMAGPAAIPYPDHSADSAIVLAVLHHVRPADLGPLLADLRRVSRRAIIEEDSYELPPELPGVAEALERDEWLRAFVALAPQDQLRVLMFVDYFANAIAQGIPPMATPSFRTVKEWWQSFEEQGWTVVQTKVLGFQVRNFNRSCHVWFVIEDKLGS